MKYILTLSEKNILKIKNLFSEINSMPQKEIDELNLDFKHGARFLDYSSYENLLKSIQIAVYALPNNDIEVRKTINFYYQLYKDFDQYGNLYDTKRIELDVKSINEYGLYNFEDTQKLIADLEEGIKRTKFDFNYDSSYHEGF